MPESSISAIDVSRQVGEGDATASPTAEANAMSVANTTAAVIAPAMTGPQWM